LGTQVRFPELYGDKVFVVRDRMNARYGYGRIDIWLPELSEAKIFGAQWLVMEVF
jgi:3D (Asp-Asp-Asp) domain-containing protein